MVRKKYFLTHTHVYQHMVYVSVHDFNYREYFSIKQHNTSIHTLMYQLTISVSLVNGIPNHKASIKKLTSLNQASKGNNKMIDFRQNFSDCGLII